MDQHVHLPSFIDEVKCGQEIFELGRDEHTYLRIGHGRVENPSPMFYDGYHDMDVLGGLENFEVHFLLFICIILLFCLYA